MGRCMAGMSEMPQNQGMTRLGQMETETQQWAGKEIILMVLAENSDQALSGNQFPKTASSHP